MGKAKTRVLAAFALGLGGFVLASCVDQSVVDRFAVPGFFDTPSESAGGMLGYSDTPTRLTVCGNCHVGPQEQWAATGHAGAWADLQASGYAQPRCENCHTVNELGNVLTDRAGFSATGESRYHDVQCESCHGPGLNHVTAPDNSTVPLAVLSTGVDNDRGCGECHQGTHHPFVEQWEGSGHGNLNPILAANPECAGCHEGRAALARLGVPAVYADEGAVAITCAVCHDPHGSENTAQLRVPVAGVPARDNLCARCHDRVSVPRGGEVQGIYPHAPETALLTGEAGFFFPGMEVDRGEIVGTHGTEANDALCAACHVAQTTITDADTGEFIFQATGHGFNAIPCVDGVGVPGSGDCLLSVTGRTFAACATSGCHTSEDDAYTKLRAKALLFDSLVTELDGLLRAVDPNLDGVGGEIDPTNRVLTTAEGAFFNMLLARFGGTARPSYLLAYTGAAAHNPFLVEQLLVESINAVNAAYAPAPTQEPEFAPPPRPDE